MPRKPVWKLGEESLWSAMGYVVFPGNVGGLQTLVEVVEKLKSEK